MKIRLSAPTLRGTLLSILKGEKLKLLYVMIPEFSTFDMRFSSGAELPTDFVDSVPVSDVEAKGGEKRHCVMDSNLVIGGGSGEEEYTDEFHVQREEGTGFSPTDKAQVQRSH